MRECFPAAPTCFGGAGALLGRPGQQAAEVPDDALEQLEPQPQLSPGRRTSADEESERLELRRAKSQLLQEKYSELEKQNCVFLEADLYTNAFVSSLHPPRPDKSNNTSTGAIAEVMEMVVSIFAMLLVPFIQLLMGYAVYLHVQNNLIQMHSYPLFTAYEMFVGSNITVPLHTVEALCGSWEDQEMQPFSTGPLKTMKMPDGTVYSPNERYSLFYNLKQPTRTWDYGRLGEERSVLDDVMFVISEGVTLNPFTPSGYSLLFVMTLAMLFFSIGREFRSIARWATMLSHLDVVESRRTRRMRLARMASSSSATADDGVSDRAVGHNAHRDFRAEIWHFNAENCKFEIQGLTCAARVVGMLAFVCRFAVVLALLCLGTLFLVFTTLKIDLILNGLALLFLLELGSVVYFASVPGQRQKFIDGIEPIRFVEPQSKKTIRGHKVPHAQTLVDSIIPSLMFPLNFFFALLGRWYQVHVFRGYFRMTAAICMFAGPTVPFADKTMVSPVAGFCDSLLGVTCAPSVVPDESRRKHGNCIITDQTTMAFPTVQFYLDDPTLFENRFNADGSSKSWVEWGHANPKLYKSGRWMKGQYQDLLRKQCLQLYQKDIPPDDVIVDDDVGETMDGAPFMCAMEPVFEAVFGDVRRAIFQPETPEIRRKIWQVFGMSFDGTRYGGSKAAALVKDLHDPAVVAAIDKCRMSKVWSPEQRARDGQATLLATEGTHGRAAVAHPGPSASAEQPRLDLEDHRRRLRRARDRRLLPGSGPDGS